MKTIFIPETVWSFTINKNIKETQKFLPELDFKEFNSRFIKWIMSEADDITNILPVLNWYYWRDYFVWNYFWNFKKHILWHILMEWDSINDWIKTLESDIININKRLASPFLFTRSSKEKIKSKLIEKIVSLAWIAFQLDYLLNESKANLKDLEGVSKWNRQDYAWNADILRISITNKISELKQTKENLDKIMPSFLELISKYLK